MKIKDYLILKEIQRYLENQLDLELKDNNHFTNMVIEKLKRMYEELNIILSKLENED